MKRLMTKPRIRLGHEQLVVMLSPPTLLGGVAAPLTSMMGVPAYPGWEVPSRTTGQANPGRPKLPVVMVFGPEPMAKSMVVVVASPAFGTAVEVGLLDGRPQGARTRVRLAQEVAGGLVVIIGRRVDDIGIGRRRLGPPRASWPRKHAVGTGDGERADRCQQHPGAAWADQHEPGTPRIAPTGPGSGSGPRKPQTCEP